MNESTRMSLQPVSQFGDFSVSATSFQALQPLSIGKTVLYHINVFHFNSLTPSNHNLLTSYTCCDQYQLLTVSTPVFSPVTTNIALQKPILLQTKPQKRGYPAYKSVNKILYINTSPEVSQ